MGKVVNFEKNIFLNFFLKFLGGVVPLPNLKIFLFSGLVNISYLTYIFIINKRFSEC
jgi:hypothetical protein